MWAPPKAAWICSEHSDYILSANDPREEPGICALFYDLALEVTHHYLCYISLVTQTRPDPVWEELTQGHKGQGSSLRPSLKLGIHAVIF